MADNKEEAQSFLEKKKAEAKAKKKAKQDAANEEAKKAGRAGLDKSFDGGKDTSARKGNINRFRK